MYRRGRIYYQHWIGEMGLKPFARLFRLHLQGPAFISRIACWLKVRQVQSNCLFSTNEVLQLVCFFFCCCFFHSTFSFHFSSTHFSSIHFLQLTFFNSLFSTHFLRCSFCSSLFCRTLFCRTLGKSLAVVYFSPVIFRKSFFANLFSLVTFRKSIFLIASCIMIFVVHQFFAAHFGVMSSQELLCSCMLFFQAFAFQPLFLLMSHFSCAAIKPLVQACWKLKPPVMPSTSSISPAK